MIFVTVGSQLPFDRLISTLDQWSTDSNSESVFAQIGNSEYRPKNIEFCKTMSPDDYSAYFKKADIIVAHAGMGTIISALELGKPLVLLPRLARNGEHRNDHQLATAKHFSSYKNIVVANNSTELLSAIDKLLAQNSFSGEPELTEVSTDLVFAIKEFVSR